MIISCHHEPNIGHRKIPSPYTFSIREATVVVCCTPRCKPMGTAGIVLVPTNLLKNCKNMLNYIRRYLNKSNTLMNRCDPILN